jgi:hypothetical protein
VASLDAPEAQSWLTDAVAGDWSAQQLRTQIKQRRRAERVDRGRVERLYALMRAWLGPEGGH